MAQSPINTPRHFGEWKSIKNSLPYVVEKDGFVKVSNNPVNVGNAYLIYTGSISGTMRVNSFGGMEEFGVFPVKKGETISFVTSGGVGTASIDYLPISGE
jgi:hypothetical protein